MKNTKAKAAPTIEWKKRTGCDDYATRAEWDGYTGREKPAFTVSISGDTAFLYLLRPPQEPVCLGRYMKVRTAKLGAERLAKRMRETFAEDGK